MRLLVGEDRAVVLYAHNIITMATWGGFSDREVSEVKVKLHKDSRSNKRGRLEVSEKQLHRPHEETQPTSDHRGGPFSAADRISTVESVHKDELSPSSEPSDDSSTATADVLLVTRIRNPSDFKEQPTSSYTERSTSSNTESVEELQEKLKKENIERKLKIENALKERCEKSSREVEKLQLVKEELAKIDGLVSRDVSLLRGKIEEADKNFNKAKLATSYQHERLHNYKKPPTNYSRSRFSVAEKEYVAAKLTYYEAKEKKELLSEHLCTIIRHTEMRKASKLKTLMSDLQLEDIVPESPLVDTEDSSHSATSTDDKVNPHMSDGIPLGSSMINIHRLD